MVKAQANGDMRNAEIASTQPQRDAYEEGRGFRPAPIVGLTNHADEGQKRATGTKRC
jgi:hypothetical protein